MDDIYRENILEHFKNPKNYGKMPGAQYSYEQSNPLCGDRIKMQIKIKDQKSKIKNIEKINFLGEGCAISMASASMLTEKVLGKSLGDVENFSKKDILEMLGITLSPIRIKCALLPLEVLQKTLVLAKGK